MTRYDQRALDSAHHAAADRATGRWSSTARTPSSRSAGAPSCCRLHPRSHGRARRRMPAAGAGERALPPGAVGAGGRGAGRRWAGGLGGEAHVALVRAARAGARRRGRDRRGRREVVAAGTARGRRRRQQPGRGARDRRRRAARDLLSRAGRLARRARRRRARRRRAASWSELLASPAAATRTAWPRGLAYVPAPHAPYSVGRELFRKIFLVAARTAVPTSVHVAEDRDEIALLRDGSGALAAPSCRAWASIPTTRIAGQTPVAYLASLGAFDAPAPPLLVHMVHADADGSPPRARGRRHRGALSALEPAHHRRAARRRRCSSRRRAAGASAPTAWRRRPISRCGARSRRCASASPPCRPRRGWTPPRAAAPRPCSSAPWLAGGRRPPRDHRGHAAHARTPARRLLERAGARPAPGPSAGGRAREPSESACRHLSPARNPSGG